MSALRKNNPAIIAIALVLINFLIKGFFLSNNSLGGDEPFSVYHAQMDVAAIIKLLSEGNNPPLYEVILHYWIKLFGISEFAVRFPSLIFSSISVLFIYKLGAKYLNKRIALYAGILFIFSNYQILYAHVARVYALLGMLSIVSMYYFLGVIDIALISLKEGAKFFSNATSKRKLILLLFTDILIIYAHYFGFFILLTQFLYLLVNRKLFLRFWKQIVISGGIIALFYLPNIIVLFNRFLVSSGGTWVSPPDGIVSIYSMIRRFSNSPVVTVSVLTVFFFALVSFIIRKKSKPVDIHYGLIVFWFLFVFFFMFGISYITPIFLDRYLMPCTITFSLLLGIALDVLVTESKRRYIIPVIVCVLFVVTANPNISNKRNVREAVKKVNEIKDTNTLVLICPRPFVINFMYYFDQKTFKNYDAKNSYSNIESALSKRNVFAINSIKEVKYKKWNHIIYLDAAADFAMPNNNIRNELNKTYTLKHKYKIYEIYTVFDYQLK